MKLLTLVEPAFARKIFQKNDLESTLRFINLLTDCLVISDQRTIATRNSSVSTTILLENKLVFRMGREGGGDGVQAAPHCFFVPFNTLPTNHAFRCTTPTRLSRDQIEYDFQLGLKII